MIHQVEFKGQPFGVVEGVTHPAYSVECFKPGGEEYDFRAQHWNVKPGDYVVDAGASYGAYTLAALVSEAVEVWSFEPEPSVFRDLCKNLDVNGYQNSSRVFAAEIALWDSVARIDMKGYAPHWPEQTVTGLYNAMPLDDLAGSMSRFDWFKVDVEGAEERVIRGALHTINKFRPKLIVEAHLFLDEGIPNKIAALLPRYQWQWVERGDEVVMMIGESR